MWRAHMTEHFSFGQLQIGPSLDHAKGACWTNGISWRVTAQFQIISHSHSLMELRALCNMQGPVPTFCPAHVGNVALIVSWHIVRTVLQCQMRLAGVPSCVPRGILDYIDGAARFIPYAAPQAAAHVISILHDVTFAFVDATTDRKKLIPSKAVICNPPIRDALSTSTSFVKPDALGDCEMVKQCVAFSNKTNTYHMILHHELRPQLLPSILCDPFLLDGLASWLLDIVSFLTSSPKPVLRNELNLVSCR